MSTKVEQIKDRLDIVDIISSYIKLDKAGINWKARCPFHNEKSPSFFVSPTRQTFYCFGCGAKGDIFSFVEKMEGLDFKGSLKILADRAGIKMEQFSKEDSSEKEYLFEIIEEATKFFETLLEQNKKASEYLKKRGVMEKNFKKWRLGFAKDEWRSLYSELLKKGFSVEQMLGAGLIKKASENGISDSETKYYDTFRDRIIFPISDSSGRVIAFSGRTMKNEKSEKIPKYLNSPETKLFRKSEVLHGFHLAKNYIRKLDYAVLVEGQMDLIMSHQSGVPNTIAASGTALSEEHLKKIQKITNRIIMAYDSDSAGTNAALRSATMALALGMEPKIATLPKDDDPASIIYKNPEIWKKALRESEHIVDFAIKKSLSAKNSRESIKQITREVLPIISLLKSSMEKSQFVKKISLSLGIGTEAILEDLSKIKPDFQSIKKPFENLTEKKERNLSLERILAGIIFLKENNGKNFFSLKERWQKIASYPEEVAEIIDEFKEEKEILIYEAEKYSNEMDLEKVSEEILNRIEKQNLKKKLQKKATLLDNQNISKEEEVAIKIEIKNIQKRIGQLEI